MKSTRCIGRVAGLAIELGTGTWVASVPWLAAAEPDSSGVAIADPSGLDLVGPAAADPSGLNIEVSYNGMDLFHVGDATAISGNDSLAIAIGDGSTADAGTYTADGATATGSGDYAFADGAGSTAVASGTDFDSATATDGATAYSGVVVLPDGISFGGSEGGDVATATGAGSSAAAGFGNYDSADVFGTDITASATGGSFLYDNGQLLFGAATDTAATEAPTDDFGLSGLGLESLVPGLDSLLNLF